MNKQSEKCAVCDGPLSEDMDWSICDDCFRHDQPATPRTEVFLTTIAFIAFTAALCFIVGALFALGHVG